jgi:hypothetical protein
VKKNTIAEIEVCRSYYFDIPGVGSHNFICVFMDADNAYFVLVTSQYEKHVKRFENPKFGLDFSSLVPLDIKKCGLDDLTNADSCINCNKVHVIPKEGFIKDINLGKVEIRKSITELYYEKILRGIVKSDPISVSSEIRQLARLHLQPYE